MQKSRKQRQNKVWHFFARIAALLVMMGIVAGYTAPAVYAAGSGPIIHWDSTMIYAGQNNGYPWGPVGENTIVHGEKFTPNQQLRLMLVQGDSNTDATICKTSGVSVGTITTDASGTFQQNFAWPASAGQVNQKYSICSLLLADASVVSNQDDGPFTVLSASPPSISVTPTSLVAGNTVTVTGQNWVPPQQVSINIAGCAACDPGPSEVTNANATSSGLNSGTFS